MNKKNAHFEISSLLISWYADNKRELPWRQTKDPYIIWISEIILQQTRVVQGHPYFLRFLEAFPDVLSLARATEDEVLKVWQGLGYYSRARNLHAAARHIATHFEGQFPRSYTDIASLKGVGEYTAAAIVSFAYGMPYAVVDGNVSRVISRLFAIDDPIDITLGKKRINSLAHEMLNPARADLHNQSIMELGALICTPLSPKCADCPLLYKCMAYGEKKVLEFPVKTKTTKVRNRYFHYFFIESEGCTYLKKRTENDIWKNLHEFPSMETPKETPLEKLLVEKGFNTVLGNYVEDITAHHQLKHVLSHQLIYATFYKVRVRSDFKHYAQKNGYIEISPSEIDAYAVSRLIHRYLEWVRV